MTLSTAFNVALSGLTAAGRASGVVSGNIANAMTPGYSRRTLEVGTNALGGGVRTQGIVRHSDPVLTATRRGADASFGYSDALARFHQGLENAVGGPDDPTSLVNRLADFEGSLISAASNPGSRTRLDLAVTEAGDLSHAIAEAAEGLRDLRTDADRRIGQMVTRINEALVEVEQLNVRIQNVTLSGSDPSTLLDQRQMVVDEINQMVPVNIAQRQNGMIALYSDGGAILVDSSAAQLEFTSAAETRPHMTVGNGLLSGLQIDGLPVRSLGPNSAIRGGALAAQFEIRDDLAVEAQKDLDALARDLIERFQDPGVDPTLAPGDAGLFTDDGSAFVAANEPGVANRLSLNAAVDPDQGGETWRIRDGLGAVIPGSVGDATLLSALGTALTQARAQPTTRFGTGDLTAAGLSTAVLSKTAQAGASASQSLSFAAANRTEMLRIELERGVDTDAELQSLMQIEQAYAANARVLQVVEELMDTLLGI